MRARLLAIGTVLLSACGSGGGGGGGPAELTLSLSSDTALDGIVRSDGSVSVGSNDCFAGDVDMPAIGPMGVATHVGERGFVSFDLSTLPFEATITSATLTLTQFTVEGDPYGDGHGDLILDHLDYGATLEAADYDALAISSDFGTLSSDATLGAKTVDVTAQVAFDAAAGRAWSQFRLRFSAMDSDLDDTGDRAGFYSGASTVSPPVLTIRYLP